MDPSMKQGEAAAGAPPPYYSGQGPVPAPGPVPQAAPAQVSVTVPPTVSVQATTILGEFPVAMQCPHCHSSVQTRISHQAGTLTYLAALGICVLGGFLGCCLIPFCLDFCLDVVHTCPNCNAQLGVYQRLH